MVEFLSIIKNYDETLAFKVLDGENSTDITYIQYYKKVCLCAYNLEKKYGDIKGKHVGIYINSSYEYTVLLGAVIFSRAVAVPLNARESLDNVLFEIDNADIDILIVDEEHQTVRDKVTIGVLHESEALCECDQYKELYDFNESEENNTVLIVYTSGTSGRPKGVVASAGNMFKWPKELFNEIVPFDSIVGHRNYSNFPFFHIGGILGWIMLMENGCTAYLSINPGNILLDLANNSIDHATVTPATMKLLAKTVKRGHSEKLGGMKMIATAGAPMDISTNEVFLNNGILYGQYYGMTESCGNITSNFDCFNHPESVGRPNPMVEVKIIDGEICVKSPGVMQGYYKNEEETKKALIDGYLHTGDLGYIDEDGYVYITGRKKNLIILSGGENVSPEELEKLMYADSKVKECKAFEKNDRIHMAVYCNESDKEEIKSFVSELNKTLPIFKRIYKVDFTDKEFEKTASGKIKVGGDDRS